jgi:hypothetical protein
MWAREFDECLGRFTLVSTGRGGVAADRSSGWDDLRPSIKCKTTHTQLVEEPFIKWPSPPISAHLYSSIQTENILLLFISCSERLALQKEFDPNSTPSRKNASAHSSALNRETGINNLTSRLPSKNNQPKNCCMLDLLLI